MIYNTVAFAALVISTTVTYGDVYNGHLRGAYGVGFEKWWVEKFGKPKRCDDVKYKTGRCTACPGQLYQSCQTLEVVDKHGQTTNKITGAPDGNSYCGFLGCQLNCKAFIWDFGCGCNAGTPLVYAESRSGTVQAKCANGSFEWNWMPGWRKDRRRSEQALGKAAAYLELDDESEVEPVDESELGDLHEMEVDLHEALVMERQLHNYQDLRMFCEFAKRESACGESCAFVTSDDVFRSFLPVDLSDPCGSSAKVADICSEACAAE